MCARDDQDSPDDPEVSWSEFDFWSGRTVRGQGLESPLSSP